MKTELVKKIHQEIDEVLEIVYEKAEEGSDKERTVFFNGANLSAIIIDLFDAEARFWHCDCPFCEHHTTAREYEKQKREESKNTKK